MEPDELPDLTPDEALAAERRQLDDLLGRGMSFTTPKRSVLRWLGGPADRTWTLRQPYLQTMLEQDAVLIQIDFSEESLAEGQMAEARRVVGVNAKLCAEYIAIGLLEGRFGSTVLLPLLTRYLLRRLNGENLLRILIIMQELAGYGNFINSIRLLSRLPRRTQPTPIEQAPAVPD